MRDCKQFLPWKTSWTLNRGGLYLWNTDKSRACPVTCLLCCPVGRPLLQHLIGIVSRVVAYVAWLVFAARLQRTGIVLILSVYGCCAVCSTHPRVARSFAQQHVTNQPPPQTLDLLCCPHVLFCTVHTVHRLLTTSDCPSCTFLFFFFFIFAVPCRTRVRKSFLSRLTSCLLLASSLFSWLHQLVCRSVPCLWPLTFNPGQMSASHSTHFVH